MMAVRCPGPELLERAIRYAVCGVDSVEPSSLHSPTPCYDWDLRDLLHHLTESLLTLGELLGGPPLAGRTSEPVAGTRAAATLVLAVIARVDTNGISAVEGLPIPASLVAYTGALEVALHAW
ncbi:MAG: hypothetical protein QOJ62_821, partial [Actinomycetota bacterium]|nr:hypothetical protein [Actinomycetota bacterium]